MKNDVLISLHNISYSYNRHQVLKDINLEVVRGEYLGIIGPNGGGKTTLIKLVLGFFPLQTGSISIFGQPLNRFKDWSRIGYVPQRMSQKEIKFPATVSEIVGLGYLKKTNFWQKFSDPQKQILVKKAMNIADIWNIRNDLITQLSGGQLQRVFIARALVSDPEILILDEPTVGVDIETQEKFYDFLHLLNKQHNLTLILISHDIDVIINEVNEVACLNKTLICDIPPKQFIQENYFSQVYGKSRRLLLHNH